MSSNWSLIYSTGANGQPLAGDLNDFKSAHHDTHRPAGVARRRLGLRRGSPSGKRKSGSTCRGADQP